MSDYIELIVAENNEGKRGLFQLNKPQYVTKGDLLWSLGKFWEIIAVDRIFLESRAEEYEFIRKCCDHYEVVGADVEAIYTRKAYEDNAGQE